MNVPNHSFDCKILYVQYEKNIWHGKSKWRISQNRFFTTHETGREKGEGDSETYFLDKRMSTIFMFLSGRLIFALVCVFLQNVFVFVFTLFADLGSFYFQK